MKNIISSVEIKVDEAAELRELYIIKVKRDIFMLENNVQKNLYENKTHVELKEETKLYNIREEVEDNAIRIIAVHGKTLKGHASKLEKKFNFALKKVIYAKLAHKEERNQVLDFQEQIAPPN